MLDKIAEIYGVDPSHFRQLLKLDKTVTKHAQGDKQGFSQFSYGLACCIYVLMGIPVAFIPLARMLDAPLGGVRLRTYCSVVHDGDGSVFELLSS